MVEMAAAPAVVVTGASEGLGRALALEFARGGHALLLVARTGVALEDAAAEIRKATGAAVYIQDADLSAPDGIERVVHALDAHGLHAEFLVNNAAMGLSGYFAEHEPGDAARLTDLNVRALTGLASRFLPGMIARGRGGVLNVASIAGFLPGPYQAAYYASKAYVISLSEALAHEVSGTGVRVAVLAPGPLKTKFHQRMGSQNDFYIRFLGVMDPERVARAGYAQFMRGRRVIVPGVFNRLGVMFQRVVPRMLLVPFVAWLLKHREGPDDA